MTHPRRLALAATTVAALSALTACGSSDDSTAADSGSSSSASSSTSASTSPGATSSSSSAAAAGGDLCQVFAAGPQGLDSNDPATAVAAAHGFAAKLGAVSTTDLSSDASAGLQAYTAFLGGIDEAQITKLEANSEASPDDVFGDKAGDVEAFFSYLQQTCAPQLSPSASPTQ